MCKARASLRLRRRSVVALLALLLLAGPALGYGYTRDEDPLLKSFKAVVLASRESDWDAIAAQTKAVQWQLDELKAELEVDLQATLEAPLKDRDRKALVISWANLVALALKQKFYWNIKEGLADFPKAKARWMSARYYYDVVLAGNVKRFDARNETRHHEEIQGLFDRARTQLGRPAILGTASRDADLPGFRETAAALLARIEAVFPYFEAGAGLPE